MMIPILFALFAAAAAPDDAPAIPPAEELRQQILARDAELFRLFFERCDPAAMRSMIADDVEFYHDRDGFVFRNADQFVAGYSKNCASLNDPASWRSRRALVADSVRVDPVPGHGAIQAGEHLFYERRGGDGEERLAGRARFAMVWVLEQGQWKLSRVLSFAHAAADMALADGDGADILPSSKVQE